MVENSRVGQNFRWNDKQQQSPTSGGAGVSHSFPLCFRGFNIFQHLKRADPTLIQLGGTRGAEV